jgi:hypothetical protein
MARTNFENLAVYQMSERLADEIWDIVQGWTNFARDTVGKQIVRAADSVGANIAEAAVDSTTARTNGSFGFLVAPSTRRSTGWAGRFGGNSCPTLRSRHSARSSITCRPD